MTRRVWLAADVAFLLMFALSVAVQFNDPDPLRWSLLYAAAAIASLLSALDRPSAWLAWGIAAVAAFWAVWLAPSVIGSVSFADMFGAWEMKDAGIERSREMYGLLLVCAWMIAVAVRARRRSAQRA